MSNVLITGSAGFIGFHLSKRLISEGFNVVGLDNINDYYDTSLKTQRLDNINDFIKTKNNSSLYKFHELDISNYENLIELFNKNNFDTVINLAAQAGVRYSLDNPKAYIDSNLVGFGNILECCRHKKIKHLIYASSSSVYGMNIKQPFSTSDNTDYPISLYAATKKSNELLAHSYSHLFNLPTTGLRFFTVYGPYGRPDMAYYSFTKSIIEGKPINVFNKGEMQRDFTYVDDIVEGIYKLIYKIPKNQKNDISLSDAPYKIFNIGNNNPVTLRNFISAIENATGIKAIENLLPMQAGDVPITYADISDLQNEIGFSPSTSIEDGIGKFVDWYKKNHNLQ
tara:strand:- start:1473 stop:2489 length:1017 start_codon:yes stop_codon:yes gene_type:complete